MPIRQLIKPSVMQLADLLQSSQPRFASLRYRAEGSGELAIHSLTLGIKIQEVYKADVRALETFISGLALIPMSLRDQEWKNLWLASNEMVQSLTLSLSRWKLDQWHPDYAHANIRVDVEGTPGVWIHSETGVLYLNSFSRRKRVLEAGEYKVVKHSAKTLAKMYLKKKLKLGHDKLRTFRLGNIDIARARGRVLIISGNYK